MAGLLTRDDITTGLGSFSTRNGWVLEHWRAGAQLLHQRPILTDQQRRISLLKPTRPALVLGSTSPFPADLAGMESSASINAGDSATLLRYDLPQYDLLRYDIARRRSGGGLVWLDPSEATWLDVFVPVGDELWHHDVALSFEWLGKAIAEAFVSFGISARVHQGEFEPGPAGGLICFGSLGYGEVVAGDSPQRKLVGISQRRTHLGSRFQCLWYRHFTLGAITQLAHAEDCEATVKRSCGWGNLGPAFKGITSSEITRRVITRLTNA